MVEPNLFGYDFASLALTGSISFHPDSGDMSDTSGYFLVDRQDGEGKVRFDYYNCDFASTSGLVTIKEEGCISMVGGNNDAYALANLFSFTATSQNEEQDYWLLRGFAGADIGTRNDVMFEYMDGASYKTSKAPRRLGDKPSYLAIVNPNEEDLVLSNIHISYEGGSPRSNPYALKGARFNAVAGIDIGDLDNKGLPSDKSSWTIPDLGSDDEAMYSYQLGYNHHWDGEGEDPAPTNSWEYDVGIDIIMPKQLEDVITIRAPKISYPSSSYLASDSSRAIGKTISEIKEKAGGEVNEDFVRVTLSAKNAVINYQGGPYLSFVLDLDLSGFTASEKQAIYGSEFYVCQYWDDASEDRPYLTGEGVSEAHEAAYKLTPSTETSQLTWVRTDFVAGSANPVLNYKGNQISASGTMVEGKKYTITYVEGASTYTFA